MDLSTATPALGLCGSRISRWITGSRIMRDAGTTHSRQPLLVINRSRYFLHPPTLRPRRPRRRWPPRVLISPDLVGSFSILFFHLSVRTLRVARREFPKTSRGKMCQEIPEV